MASPAADSNRQLIVDTQQALTSSRRAVATSRATLHHCAPVLQPPRPPSQPRPVVLEPWLELEAAIDRLARLVIHAQALADRTAALPAIVEAADRHRRADRSTSCEPPWTSGNARSPPPQLEMLDIAQQIASSPGSAGRRPGRG